MAPKRRPPVVVKPQPSERKQRKKRLPETSSDKDSEAEETAVVVAESEPEAEDKASDDKEKIFSEAKESSTQYVQHVFQRPLRGHTATMDRDKQARVLAEKGKRRDLLDFVVPKTSPRQINPTARTISKNLLCRRLEMQRRRILV